MKPVEWQGVCERKTTVKRSSSSQFLTSLRRKCIYVAHIKLKTKQLYLALVSANVLARRLSKRLSDNVVRRIVHAACRVI